MAQQTFNVTANLIPTGTTVANGTMTWTPPSLSPLAEIESIVISGSWTWDGKGNISNITIDGKAAAATNFNINLSTNVVPPINCTVVGNKNATGDFIIWNNLQVTYTYYIYYNINITQTSGGTISTNVSKAEAGDTVRITTTPSTGYKLDRILLDGVELTGTSFVMPEANVSITAEWSKIPYTVSMGTNTGCTASVSVNTAFYNDTITVTATPSLGYENPIVYINGSPISGMEFSMPASNVTVTVVCSKIQYSIIQTSNEGCTWEFPATATYMEEVTVTITPNIGYEKPVLYVDGVAIEGYTFTMPAKNVQLWLMCTKAIYTLTTEVVGCTATLSVETASYQDNVSITINIEEGYENPIVYINGTALGGTGTSFSMPAQNTIVRVECSKIQYIITNTQSTGGTFSTNKNAAGFDEIITITATPDTGYYLEKIYLNGVELTGNSFVMLKANATITVSWKKIDYTIIKGSAEGCTYTLSKETANYQDEIIVYINLLPGYENAIVYVDSIPIEGASFILPANNVTVQVVAKKINYTITITQSVGGTLLVKPTAVMEEEVTITVNPDIGYELSKIYVNGLATDSTTFIMPLDNVNITVEWVMIDYIATFSENIGCTATFSANETEKIANYQDDILVKINLLEGYEKPIIYVNDVQVENPFKMPAADASIKVIATKIQLTITVIQPENGLITPSTTIVEYGDDFTFNIIPDDKMFIIATIVDDISVGDINSYTFNNITTNHKITAIIKESITVARIDKNGTLKVRGELIEGKTKIYFDNSSIYVEELIEGAAYTFTNKTKIYCKEILERQVIY